MARIGIRRENGIDVKVGVMVDVQEGNNIQMRWHTR